VTPFSSMRCGSQRGGRGLSRDVCDRRERAGEAGSALRSRHAGSGRSHTRAGRQCGSAARRTCRA
jgi:hypothetical protein